MGRGKPGRLRIQEMNAYYEKVAPLHDTFMGYTNNEAMEELLAPIIEWVEPFVRDRRVLEIACGTGNWTQVLSKRALKVTAVDRSAAYLALARPKTYAGGNVAFPFTPPEVSVGTAYRFNIYHLLKTDDLDALFPLEIERL